MSKKSLSLEMLERGNQLSKVRVVGGYTSSPEEFVGRRVRFSRPCTEWAGINMEISWAEWDLVWDEAGELRRVQVTLVGPELHSGVLFMCIKNRIPLWWMTHKMTRGGSSEMNDHGLGRRYRLDIV